MTEKINGLLVKAVGGFYYVKSGDNIYECKARGSFRIRGGSPLVGDSVLLSVNASGYPSIEEVFPRRNALVRPPLANLDNLVIVCSVSAPAPNALVTDKMIAAAVYNDINPVVVITKTDLGDCSAFKTIYSSCGIDTYTVNALTGEGIDALYSIFPDKITAFTGNSGVGKSTLLNALFPDLMLQTGEISKKLGRGRHTTRTVELFEAGGGYVADTPGFSTMELESFSIIRKESLASCFPEFEPYIGECRFTSCAHICEKGCAVLQAVKDGKIQSSRHISYVAMYNEIKDIKEWERKPK